MSNGSTYIDDLKNAYAALQDENTALKRECAEMRAAVVAVEKTFYVFGYGDIASVITEFLAKYPERKP